MFRRLPLRRSTRTRLLRASLLLLLLFTAIDILSLSRLRATISPPLGSPQNPPSLPRKPYTGAPLLLASTHWNNAPVLSSNWTTAVLALAAYLGPSNLFVSIVESGSWDNSGEILRDLDRELGKLGVGRRVLTGMDGGRSHKEEMERPMGKGWVDTGGDRGRELRRVPYLAGVRNKVLEELEEGGESVEAEGRVKRRKDDKGREDGKETKRKSKRGLKSKPKVEKQSVEAKGQSEKQEKKEGEWDWSKLGKVVWVNDVVFTVDDILNLINTRDGDYAAACSMDYAKPPAYYDTFALRDIEGYEAVTSTFPYFRSKISRDAMIAGQPVPVQSCWNGMVSFDATPFLSTPPLTFRGIPDSLAALHLEASECCLIHTDNPLTPSKGVWLNPAVRVAYSPSAYAAVHTGEPWPGLGEAWWGVWWNRVVRWGTSEGGKRWRVGRRVRGWEGEGEGEGKGGEKGKGEARWEPGIGCLINEMQVLRENGWAHV